MKRGNGVFFDIEERRIIDDHRWYDQGLETCAKIQQVDITKAQESPNKKTDWECIL